MSNAPVAIAPFDPHECVVPELFCELSIDAMPAPGEAEAETVEVVGAGELILNPVGKVHCAREMPQTPVPAGGALFTVRLAEADRPVSSVPTKRLLEMLL